MPTKVKNIKAPVFAGSATAKLPAPKTTEQARLDKAERDRFYTGRIWRRL